MQCMLCAIQHTLKNLLPPARQQPNKRKTRAAAPLPPGQTTLTKFLKPNRHCCRPVKANMAQLTGRFECLHQHHVSALQHRWFSQTAW